MTQIMALLNLAPDVIEEILFLPNARSERVPVTERDMLSLAASGDWLEQRERCCITHET